MAVGASGVSGLFWTTPITPGNQTAWLTAGVLEDGGVPIGGVSIGGLVVGGTPGSVLFVDSAGDLGQDNSHFLWDQTNQTLNFYNSTVGNKQTIAIWSGGLGVGLVGAIRSDGNVAGTQVETIDDATAALSQNAGLPPVGVKINSTSALSWSNSTHWWDTADVTLWRDGAGILAQQNGTNAQVFNVYNTFTNSTNYERAKFGWNSNVLEIGTENAGTGVARNFKLLAAGSNVLDYGVTNSGYLNAVKHYTIGAAAIPGGVAASVANDALTVMPVTASYGYFSVNGFTANDNVAFVVTQGTGNGGAGNTFFAMGSVGTHTDAAYGMSTTASGRNSGDILWQTYYGGAFHQVFYVPAGTNNMFIGGAYASPSPQTLTGTSGSSTTASSSWVINPSGAFTLTLPSASSNPGMWMFLTLIAAQTVSSATSNVVPLGSATAGTPIFTATAGKYAILQSNGTNWITMSAN